MEMKVIYLAHSVHQRPMGKRIAERLEDSGKYTIYNPFYPDDDLIREDIRGMDEGHIQEWTSPDPVKSRWIVTVDLRGVRNSDMVVCIFPRRRTVGISCEMTYAWMNHIPVYSVVPEDMRGHPWIVAMSDRVYTDIDDLMNELESE